MKNERKNSGMNHFKNHCSELTPERDFEFEG